VRVRPGVRPWRSSASPRRRRPRAAPRATGRAGARRDCHRVPRPFAASLRLQRFAELSGFVCVIVARGCP
jgi:hypothetical protein